jgi:hypothetical protein
MAILSFKTVSVVVLVVLVLAYAREIPEIVSAYSVKTGRVVDKDTGKGIPGVTVLVHGWFNEGGLFQGSQGCTFAALGYTDTEGYYATPSGWRHLTPGLPIWDPHNLWTINVVKPDYTLVDSNNRQTPAGRGATVSSAWQILAVAVSDITMKKVDLPLKERVEDYGNVIGGGGCVKVNSEVYDRMHQEIFADLKSRTCALGRDAQLDESTVFGLTSLSTYLYGDSRSVERVNERMTKLDPAFSQALINNHPPHTYRASDLCQVMTAMENDR